MALAARRYIELLRDCLSRAMFLDEEPTPVDPHIRYEGWDWPPTAETMIGTRRLDNIIDCTTRVIRAGIPGDLIETGVWRGGATILMRGILAAYEVRNRTVWVADSFRGLPEPDAERWPADAGDIHHTHPELSVDLATVRRNFERYGLLDDQVRFLEGWFADTLPAAPIEQLAVLRLDGDMYGSTMEALTALYPKLSAGGFVLIDDYGMVPGCHKAVDDFRDAQGIAEEIVPVDATGVYWEKR